MPHHGYMQSIRYVARMTRGLPQRNSSEQHAPGGSAPCHQSWRWRRRRGWLGTRRRRSSSCPMAAAPPAPRPPPRPTRSSCARAAGQQLPCSAGANCRLVRLQRVRRPAWAETQFAQGGRRALWQNGARMCRASDAGLQQRQEPLSTRSLVGGPLPSATQTAPQWNKASLAIPAPRKCREHGPTHTGRLSLIVLMRVPLRTRRMFMHWHRDVSPVPWTLHHETVNSYFSPAPSSARLRSF